MSLPPIDPPRVARLGRQLPLALAPVEVRESLAAVEADWRGRALLACSGGADSVAAALWTCAHFPALQVERRLCLAHVHHGLRGEEADADAAFVEELATGLGLSFFVRRIAPVAGASEASLREGRQAALEAVAAEFGAGVLVFGHQADDVLENLLFRLCRGSSVAGLAGMRPRQELPGRPLRLRPLLLLSRDRLVAALEESGIAWREDASNASPAFTRNRLRREVVPVLREIFPRRPLTEAARAVHEQLRELDELVETLAVGMLGEAELERGDRLPRVLLAGTLPAVRRRLLEKWLRRAGERIPPREVMEAVLAAVAECEEGSWSLPGNLRLVLTPLDLRLEAVPQPSLPVPWTRESYPLPPAAPFLLPNGATLRWEIVSLDAANRERIRKGGVHPEREAYLDARALDGECLLVRAWQPGDRFQPLGAPGRRKLQDWFTDRRLSPAQKHSLPIICAPGGEIIWIPGFPPGASHCLSGSTGRALWLTYREP